MKNLSKSLKQVGLVFTMMLMIIACNHTNNAKQVELLKKGIHTVIVQKVMQTSNYTYLCFSELGNPKIKATDSLWAATTFIEATFGDTLYYKGGLAMPNFKSKELNRSFSSILFLDSLSKKPFITTTAALVGDGHNMMSSTDSGKTIKAKVSKIDVKVTHDAGFVTIGDIYSKKAEYSGKTVKVKGQVIKFSADIMHKNWIHLQDGTEANGKFDLTITTDGKVNVEDMVGFEGKISIYKNLGHGYFFEVIMEDAKILK